MSDPDLFARVLIIGLLTAASFVADARAAPGRIAYGWEGSLFTMRPDGAGARLVAADGENLSWSPDGRRIAFNNTPRGAGSQIWTARADGSQPKLVAPDAEAPAFSPDGRRLAFGGIGDSGGGRIGIVNADGSARTVLTEPSPQGGVDTDPAWSPDGRRIAFVRVLYSGNCNGDVCRSMPVGANVHVINADGTGERLLATDASQVEWRADGKRLLIERARPAVVRPDGSGLRDLPWYGSSPSWSPDGKRVVAIAGQRPRVFTTRLDGTRRRGAGGTLASEVAWQPVQ